MSNVIAPNTLPVEQLTAILNAEVARFARKGWTVSSVQGQQAVLQRKKRIGWFWNLLLCVVTAGVWLIVVVIRMVNRKVESMILTVDAFGKISRR